MKEQLISYSTAKLAKEKGFNIPVLHYYIGVKENHTNHPTRMFDLRLEDWNSFISNSRISIPTQSFLQKYLREVYKIEIAVQWFDKGYIKAVKKHPFKANTYRMETWNSYEEALEMALFEGLNLIPDEGNNE